MKVLGKVLGEFKCMSLKDDELRGLYYCTRFSMKTSTISMRCIMMMDNYTKDVDLVAVNVLHCCLVCAISCGSPDTEQRQNS